jgi:hypothetical protein
MKYLLSIILTISFIYGDIFSDTLNKGKTIYANLKDKGSSLYNKFLKDDKEENSSVRFEKIWNSVRDNLLEGVELYNKREKAPDKTYIFGEDKEDITKDINRLLNETVSLLINRDLVSYQNRIEKLNRIIEKKKIELAEYKERRVGADNKKEFDKKIESINREIEELNQEILSLKGNLKRKFQDSGIDLSDEQIDVLLVRADGHDIIQLILIIETIKQINEQILKLVKSSGEDLVQAKRYYGMHMVSLLLVTHTQKLYMDKIKRIYIPRIDNIIKKASDMIVKTKSLISKERDDNRLFIYKENLKAQEFTKKVALEYRKNLLATIESIKRAYLESRKNLEVAKNTYDTVSLSSGLYNIINKTQMMFDRINKIQIPQIVPFENRQIKQKYRELTKQILVEN